MTIIMGDNDMARGVAALAAVVKMAAENMEARKTGGECNCNVDGLPGLCAYHAWAYDELRQAAEQLERVRAYLLKDRNER